MIWHLLAALFAGLAAAGIGLLLRVISRKRLPRWVVPVCAGLGMLGYQIHYEYSWFSHKQQQLPDTAQVTSVEREHVFWRPWTYFRPITTAFSVIDSNSMARHQADGGSVVEFILYRFEKDYIDRVTHQTYLLNCSTREMIPLHGEEHTPRLSATRILDDNSMLYQAVCAD